MPLKPLAWVGSALRDLRAFPEAVRQEAGFELYQVQLGLEPSDWKPMASVGPGVLELRIRAGGAFRVLYVTKFGEAVYVLHAFEKKSQKTGKNDLELGRQRYAALVAARHARGGR